MLSTQCRRIVVLLAGVAAGIWILGGGGSSTVIFQGKSNRTVAEGEPVGLHAAGGNQEWLEGHDQTASIHLSKQIFPAATGESPEESQRKKVVAPAGRPENLPAASKAELLDACSKQPKCRQKLDAAQKGQKPSMPLPAATSESPEESKLKKTPLPASPQSPRSELLPPSDSLLVSWLNPLRVAPAQAQTPFSVVLTPVNNSVPGAYFNIYGGNHYVGWHSIDGYLNIPSFTTTEGKAYVFIWVNVPSTGWYIINVRGYAKGSAKLRHLWNGPIIETWDFTPATYTCYPCDYATMEYLQAGAQYFYFWLTDWTILVTEVSIRSYP